MTEDFSRSPATAPSGHLQEEELAAIAEISLRGTGNDDQPQRPSAEQAQHLMACSDCRQALDTTERVLTALRSSVPIEQPPAELWDRIAAGMKEEPAEAAAPSQAQPPVSPARSGWPVTLAAAAVGALLGGAAVGGVVLTMDRQDDDPPETANTVIGEAVLEPVAAEEFSAQAEMVETAEGTMELTVQITSAPDAADGYFELWLRDEEASRLQSLGTVGTGSTTFEVPSGLDLEQYPVVDVSHEHFDGDPGHGGVTLGAGPMEQLSQDEDR